MSADGQRLAKLQQQLSACSDPERADNLQREIAQIQAELAWQSTEISQSQVRAEIAGYNTHARPHAAGRCPQCDGALYVDATEKQLEAAHVLGDTMTISTGAVPCPNPVHDD